VLLKSIQQLVVPGPTSAAAAVVAAGKVFIHA